MRNILSSKKILIVLLVFLLLGLLKPITVQAAEAGGEEAVAEAGGWLGNAIGNAKDMNKGNSGGPTYYHA